MEAKLREYRALRLRRELEEANKENGEDKSIANVIKQINFEDNMLIEEKDETLLIPVEEAKVPENEQQEVASVTSDAESFEAGPNQESWTYFITKWVIYLGIWLTFFAFFLKLQFGAVFFVVSVLVGICLNTRTRPKKLGEFSAYSVFNEDCKSIEGTLTAEQFEQEIRFGPGSVR